MHALTEKYADFSGRARRSEYWNFVLFNILGSVLATGIDLVLGMSLVGLIYSLVVLVPGIAVTVRRLHDTDRSGWMLLIGLIPIIGFIVLLVWFCTEGTIGRNSYGPDPKNPEKDDIIDHLVA